MCIRDRPAPVANVEEGQDSESILRQRFMAAYQSAKSPEIKIESLEMLAGAKEVRTLRILTGMLGDSSPEVQLAALKVMSRTPDPQGYFVNPVIGALNRNETAIKIGAAEVLGNEAGRPAAMKALAYAFADAIGNPPDKKDELYAAQLVGYRNALQKLTGKTLQRVR